MEIESLLHGYYYYQCTIIGIGIILSPVVVI